MWTLFHNVRLESGQQTIINWRARIAQSKVPRNALSIRPTAMRCLKLWMKLTHKRISANYLTWSPRIMLRLGSISTRANPVSMRWRQKKVYQRNCHSHTQRRRSAPASTCSKLKTTRNKSSSRMHQRASWHVLSTTHSQPPKLIQSSSIVAIRMASP